MKNKIKKYFAEKTKQIRWQTRYTNLQKRYDELEKKNKQLVEELATDENVAKLNDMEKTLRRYKKIVNNLREDNLKLIKKD